LLIPTCAIVIPRGLGKVVRRPVQVRHGLNVSERGVRVGTVTNT